jgi:hypothetical protein
MIMFELMLISAGGLWLGLFGLVVFCSLLWASSTDSFVLGSAVILVSAVIAEFVFSIPIWATIFANPFMLILYIAFYAAIGSLYTAVWRLPNYIKKNSANIQSEYETWKNSKVSWKETLKLKSREEEPETPTDLSYDAFLDSPYYSYSVRHNKDRVASWVLLWPASLTWELMHKPFIWLWDSVYYGLGKVFEKINRNQAKKVLGNNENK